MQAGQLRHRVSLEYDVLSTPDGMGNTHKVPTILYADVPADIHPFNSKEVYAGQQTQTITTHKITLRYLDGITTAMRVLFGSRKFTINGALDEDERKISLTLMCLEDFS